MRRQLVSRRLKKACVHSFYVVVNEHSLAITGYQFADWMLLIARTSFCNHSQSMACVDCLWIPDWLRADSELCVVKRKSIVGKPRKKFGIYWSRTIKNWSKLPKSRISVPTLTLRFTSKWVQVNCQLHLALLRKLFIKNHKHFTSLQNLFPKSSFFPTPLPTSPLYTPSSPLGFDPDTLIIPGLWHMRF